MHSLNEKFSEVGLHIPDILLPSDAVDVSRWPVIACDQYTSKRSYWEKVAEYVGDEPSTYHLILPEVYLSDADLEPRISRIKTHMREYMERSVLREYPATCVLIDRSTAETPSRKGLIIAVDLEKYDFSSGSSSLIRASEATIVERIPPRMKIRSGALCELPHILLLIDDPEKTVIEPLFSRTGELQKLYDTELMFGGGHISGYALDREDLLLELLSSIRALHGDARRKHGGTNDPLLYAVGDGNHSLATAKSMWEEIKRTSGNLEHPARWALVELNNIYDDGLTFHPIHRVLFKLKPERILSYLAAQPGVSVESRPSLENFSAATAEQANLHTIAYVHRSDRGLIRIENPRSTVAAGSLQSMIDIYLESEPEASVDYVHGTEEVLELSGEENRIGFLLPGMQKAALFRTVAERGSLPRKCFSLGEADEKRFYFECRRILE